MATLSPEAVAILRRIQAQGDMNLDQLVDAIREALGGDAEPAPSPTDEDATETAAATLRNHGIDAEQFRTLQLKDGGKAYRELKARRAATDDSGRAA